MVAMFKRAYDNEPLVITNLILVVIEAALSFAVLFDIIHPSPEQLAGVLALFTAIAGLINGIYVRGKVTPLANPKNDAGTPLVPMDQPAPIPAAPVVPTPAPLAN